MSTRQSEGPRPADNTAGSPVEAGGGHAAEIRAASTVEAKGALPPEADRPSALNEALDEIVLEGLRQLTTGLLFLCAAFVVFDWLKAHDQATIPILIGNATLTATFLALRVTLGRGSIPARFASPIGALIGLLLEAAVLLELSLRSDPVQTGYVLMIAIGAGFFVLSFRWLIPVLGVLYVAWALAIWPILSPDIFIDLSVALFSAFAMSLIVRATRVRSLRRLHNAISAAKAEAAERGEAERALSESEEKYRNLFRQSGSGKLLIDLHGTILEANQSALNLLGCTRSELVGASVLSIHSAAEADKGLQALREVTERGSARFELETIKKNGANFTAEISANLVDVGGRRLIEVIFRDVSERKQSEAIQAVLLQISQAVGTADSLYELMAIVHREVGELVDTTNFFLALYDEETGTYSFPYHVDEYDEPASHPSQRLDKSLTDYVRRIGKALLVDDAVSERLVEAGEVEIVGTLSRVWLGVPLKTAKGVIGVLVVQSYSKTSLYSEQDLGLMMVVSENIALAIERKQTEEALRLTQFAVDHAADAIFWVRSDARLLYVNDVACKSLGYTRDELLSMFVPEIAPQRSKRSFRDLWKDLRKRGSATYETIHRRKDGSTFPVELTVNYQAYGGVEHIYCLARDISVRKKIEETLYFVAQRGWADGGEGFLEALAVYLCKALDVEYVFVSELLPVDEKARTIGLCASGTIAPDIEYDLADTPCANVMGGELCYHERSIQQQFPKDTLLMDMGAESYAGVPLWDSKGDPIGLVAVIDTEPLESRELVESLLQIVAVRAAHELERKHDEEDRVRLATAIEQAGETVVITDPEGTIEYVNPAFERITGYSREEAVGKTSRILTSGKHDDAFYKDLWDTITRGEVWQGRFTNKRKDGTLYEEEATISPVRDESGRIIKYVGVKRDISEALALEAQLRQAQKMEAVGQLAGGVAHDFNNLLTGITGYTQLTLGTLDEEDSRAQDLRKVLEMSRRAADLTRQLLAFSRRQPLEPKVLNLNSLVESSSKMFKCLIGENIETEFLAATDLDNVRADPGQVEQVLMNLVVNARDAMPEGGKLIIETANTELDESACAKRPGAKPGQYVMLAVSDTGCGMDEATRRQIFEPFFTTKQKGEGTGLGLATVYGIVKQHGGNIWVYSEVGRGTSFKVYLPRVDEDVEETAADGEIAPLKKGSETILLVEDEDGVREVARRKLEMEGYRVLVAETPSEAERLFSEHSTHVDLLLTDVVMPEMDGPALHDRLSRNGRSLRVLFMSGYTAAAASYSKVLESGAPFLQKPFTPTQLAQKVLEVLNA